MLKWKNWSPCFSMLLLYIAFDMLAAWIIYLEFFFLNEFSPATATGFGFCCHWRQKCWPFRAEDHIFHLILVCSDEREAVFSPPAAERVGAHPCHPPPFHRAGVNAGATLYEWLFYQVHTVHLSDPTLLLLAYRRLPLMSVSLKTPAWTLTTSASQVSACVLVCCINVSRRRWRCRGRCLFKYRRLFRGSCYVFSLWFRLFS